jgi:hypothetical protein
MEGAAPEILGDHTLPEMYSFPHVKVIEMRGDRLSSVHEGNTAAATEFPADARWADDYRRDAQEFLLDPQTFDRTWESIQQGQVVSLVHAADTPQPVGCRFVVQVAHQRVTGIGWHRQDATLLEQLHRLLEQPSLWVVRVN